MARCDYCNSTILFGGKQVGDFRFCNESCYEKGHLVQAAMRLPKREVFDVLDEVHGGRCPKCNGQGPVDVHVAHSVWSAVYLTSWNSKPEISCRSCGVKRQFGGIVFSACLGWWGFPFGLIMTPIQICKNLGGIFSGPNPEEPSAELEKLIRYAIVAGDIGAPSGRRRARVTNDSEVVDEAFENDAFEDDGGYDEVDVVTDEKPKRRLASPSPSAASNDTVDNNKSRDRSTPRSIAPSPSSSSPTPAAGLRVTCLSCEASFKATPAVLGKRVKCPKCGNPIDVPLDG